MDCTEVYSKVYRGEYPEGYSKVEVEATINKLELIRDSYLAGVNMYILERQIGLTEEEIKELELNYQEVMERVGGYWEKGLNPSGVSDIKVEQSLYANEKLILRRMMDGEQFRTVCTDIGVAVKRKPSRNFIQAMRRKGYFIDKERKHYDITRDIYSGVSVKNILEKYKEFKTVQDFIDYYVLHQELYGDVDTRILKEIEEDEGEEVSNP